MFFDWLTIEQDMGQQIPLLDGNAYARLVVEQGEIVESIGISAPAFTHRGSFCDTVLIRASGSVIRMSGNPSRWGRLDNLWGLTSIDQCVAVYNGILSDIYGQTGFVPQFTRCTKQFQSDSKTSSGDYSVWVDGAVIRELHITDNISVGRFNVPDYLKGLSTIRYRNSIPRLHTDGNTVDWKSKLGNASLIYPMVYNKSYELQIHLLPKIARAFGQESDEYKYVQQIIAYCENEGVARFELKLKNRFLQREKLQYWGLSDYSVLKCLMDNFINLDDKLSVTSMDLETISDRLLSAGVVKTTLAANTTAMYAIKWMHGHVFDMKKRAVQTHRARLREIGIDIASVCNVSNFSPVYVTARREVVRQNMTPPLWYRMPNHLRAVA